MSKKSGFFTGFITGFLLCAVLVAVGTGLLWKNRYRVVEKVATKQVSALAEHFFKALPEGYVTKNKKLVMDVLDEFTNSMSRENITQTELQAISKTLLLNLEDGHLQHKELDKLLDMMHQAAITK
jgi:hypothetical protein